MFISCKQKENEIDKVLQLKELSELATVEYTITKIIKASDDQTWYKIGDRKILMSCQARIKSGIDLSKLKADDITIDGDKISLVLPSATILSINIRPEDIRTEYQEVGFLRSDFTAAERNLLMSQGESQIRNNIESGGILETAESNASLFIGQFLRQLGYQKIDIRFEKNSIKTNLN
jgi:RNA polymerase-interacting CarD/CdnL/TRCF family regulator